MAVPFLPSVTDSMIRFSVSSYLDFSEVKFFGGGFNTFAAKVFPSPLFPWQALQCLKKISRPISKFPVFPNTLGMYNNKFPTINRAQYVKTRNLLNPLDRPLTDEKNIQTISYKVKVPKA